MIALTDSLFAGDRDDLVWFDDRRWAQTVGEAVRIILAGDAALLDIGRLARPCARRAGTPGG